MEIKIYQTTEVAKSENGGTTRWVALNASGNGNLVATVRGNIAKCDLGHGADGVMLDGQKWTLCAVLHLAKNGERGLELI